MMAPILHGSLTRVPKDDMQSRLNENCSVHHHSIRNNGRIDFGDFT